MARTYYTACIRDRDGVWAPQFGDYDRAVVVEEMEDWHDATGLHGSKRRDMKIITTGPKQADINAAVDALNKDCRNS